MADLRISEASQAALRARLATPDGKKALLRLAQLIADTAVDAMSPEEREEIKNPEGMQAFLAAWPDLVAAFLFHGVGRESPKAEKAKTTKRVGAGKTVAKS